jgi:threonine dehydrogenase-like Zn-dependent dehydrogenase
VILAGSWDEKLDIARSCGISQTINYHREDVAERARALTGGEGPDIIIETSGSNGALHTAVQALRPTGRIVAVSWYNGPAVEVAMNTLIVKDAELIGSLASPNSFGPVLTYMASGKLKVKPLITHTRPLAELEDVVKMVREKKEMRIKILLKP